MGINEVKSENMKSELVFSAAICGDADLIKRLSLAGFDMNIKDSNGRSPLHFAVASGDLSVVKELTNCGGDVFSKDSLGEIPLHWAASSGREEVFFHLFSEMKNNSSEMHELDLQLVKNSIFGKNGNIFRAIANFVGDSITEERWNGIPILHYAAMANSFEPLMELMNMNCDHGTTDECGNTALHVASRRGSERSVEILLEAGAVVDAENDSGDTPLMEACLNNKIEVADILLKWGASSSFKTKSGWTPLYAAVVKNNYEITNKLLLCGADYGEIGPLGERALSAALKRDDSYEIVKELIRFGDSIRESDVRSKSWSKEKENRFEIFLKMELKERLMSSLKEGDALSKTKI